MPLRSPPSRESRTVARSAECWIHVDVANTPRRRAAAAYQRVSPQPRFRWSGACPSVSTQSAPEGIRTPNLLIRSQMLYPLSYGRQTHRRTTHRRAPRTSAKTSRAVRRGASLPAYPLRGKSDPPAGPLRYPPRHPRRQPAPRPTPILVRGLTRKGPNAGMPPAHHRDTVVTTAAFGWLPGRHLSSFPPLIRRPKPNRQRAPHGRPRKGRS